MPDHLSAAQWRMIDSLRRLSAGEARRFPDSGGWVEVDQVTDAWANWSAGLLTLSNATRVWQALERRLPGWAEYHPKHSTLVRPGPNMPAGTPADSRPGGRC